MLRGYGMAVTVATAEITRKQKVKCRVCGREDEGYTVAFYLGDLDVEVEVCEECFHEKVRSKATILGL